MAKNKRIHELCAQLSAQSEQGEVSGVFRVFSIKVIEYKDPKPGVIAIGSLQPEGSPHLVSVVGYRSDTEPFVALLNSPPGSIVRITRYQRFGDIRIQLMQSSLVSIENGEHYFPDPFAQSLAEIAHSGIRAPCFTQGVRISSSRLAASKQGFFPVCSVCRAKWSADMDICSLCANENPEVQFLVVLTLVDDDGGSIRAFADARMVAKIFNLPLGEISDFPSREDLEASLGETPEKLFQVVLTERSVKPDQRSSDSLVRYNVEFAHWSGTSLTVGVPAARPPPRKRRG